MRRNNNKTCDIPYQNHLAPNKELSKHMLNPKLQIHTHRKET